MARITRRYIKKQFPLRLRSGCYKNKKNKGWTSSRWRFLMQPNNLRCLDDSRFEGTVSTSAKFILDTCNCVGVPFFINYEMSPYLTATECCCKAN